MVTTKFSQGLTCSRWDLLDYRIYPLVFQGIRAAVHLLYRCHSSPRKWTQDDLGPEERAEPRTLLPSMGFFPHQVPI